MIVVGRDQDNFSGVNPSHLPRNPKLGLQSFILNEQHGFVMKRNTGCSRMDYAMHARRTPFVFGPRNTAVPMQTSPFENGGCRSCMVYNLFANGGVLI